MTEQNQDGLLLGGSKYHDDDLSGPQKLDDATTSDQLPKQSQSPIPMSQQSPFFTKLNLDVRMMIYNHMYEELPPLVHKQGKYDMPGMVLSCKQANLVSW